MEHNRYNRGGGGPRGNHDRRQDQPPPKPELDPAEILALHEKISHEGVEKIHQWVEKHTRKIKTHQMRNIFNLIRERTQDNQGAELPIARYRIAFAVAKAEDMQRDGMRQMQAVLNAVFDLMEKSPAEKRPDQIKGLNIFMEAILAYHKLYAPKS